MVPQQNAMFSVQKLIVSMPSLLQGLRTMSLTKSDPEGLNP